MGIYCDCFRENADYGGAEDSGDEKERREREEQLEKAQRMSIIKKQLKLRKGKNSSDTSEETEFEAPSLDCPLRDCASQKIPKLTVKTREHCFSMLEKGLYQNFITYYEEDSDKLRSRDYEPRCCALDLEHKIFKSNKIAVMYKSSVMKTVSEIRRLTREKELHTSIFGESATPTDNNEDCLHDSSNDSGMISVDSAFVTASSLLSKESKPSTSMSGFVKASSLVKTNSTSDMSKNTTKSSNSPSKQKHSISRSSSKTSTSECKQSSKSDSVESSKLDSKSVSKSNSSSSSKSKSVSKSEARPSSKSSPKTIPPQIVYFFEKLPKSDEYSDSANSSTYDTETESDSDSDMKTKTSSDSESKPKSNLSTAKSIQKSKMSVSFGENSEKLFTDDSRKRTHSESSSPSKSPDKKKSRKSSPPPIGKSNSSRDHKHSSSSSSRHRSHKSKHSKPFKVPFKTKSPVLPEIPPCKVIDTKGAAGLVVRYLTPYYQKGRFASKGLFKAAAKIITEELTQSIRGLPTTGKEEAKRIVSQFIGEHDKISTLQDLNTWVKK
ncbi:hypothetical protein LOTGIDRAFT_171190 [Lottia gigantea]|uniref:Set2 Rpb1 interacting domain-containing protein n=1 Tax=Lottia gigantea TaxID=225164 RepID=V4AHW2_LOTGI|nr:hypothetical protein LOTGIDRAFT_171190 [Lottia gigantea]ESP03659.1 hypothetical protein LOTGIDRAFT_171190 [Lottia gigantea]